MDKKTLRMYLRIASTLALLAGLIMLLGILGVGLSQGSSGYNVIRGVHILLALGLVGLYEMNMARNRTIMTPSGKQLGLVGRIVVTLTLVYGIFLLLTWLFGWITGDSFNGLVWVHIVLGLASVALTEIVFSRRRLKAENS